MWDVAIVGSGPAGASCAAFCARAGLRTLVLERARFPREKVCGDCLNPSCWPVLERLQIADALRVLPHGRLKRVEFVPIKGAVLSISLPGGGEIALKRSLLDQLLLQRAVSLGANVLENNTVSAICRGEQSWRLTVGSSELEARVLVAADGRNSTVARLLGLLPPSARERVGLQTHCPLPADFGNRIVLQFLPDGYSGQAPVGDGQLNVCLVATPPRIAAVKRWAEVRFDLRSTHEWRTITPLRRDALAPAAERLFLVGDAARVVEPFTGEGIFYALRSGELAAQAIATGEGGAAGYAKAHEHLYRGRLWINRLARAAVLHPRLTSALLPLARWRPELLSYLTGKVAAGAESGVTR
ncbi:MAG: NAD(P)/FAD-dependent oxidoreductase [Chthoniobacterales bacterium]